MERYLAEFLTVSVAHLLAVMAPGPDMALTIKQSVSHGKRTALHTTAGIVAGNFVHVGYSLLGIGIIIANSPLLFNTIKYLGAAYLCYVGVMSLLSKKKDDLSFSAGSVSKKAAFISGFLTNVLNPKATLYFISLFAIVIKPSTPNGVLALYALVMCVISSLWFSSVSLLFSRRGVRSGFMKYSHHFERVMGILFILFALKLALSAM